MIVLYSIIKTMKTHIVKRPYDRREHKAVKQTHTTSYGKQITLYHIVKPYDLGIYSASELETIK